MPCLRPIAGWFVKSFVESLSPEQSQRIPEELTPDEQGVLLFGWAQWARPEQLPPQCEWTGWLIMAGRGWGKTRVGAEFVRSEVEADRATRVALISETSADGRDVMVEGTSGILACSQPRFRPRYEPSKRRLTWPNGAIATLYDAREPDQLRGPEHDLVWFDELAKYRYAERVFHQAMMGLRSGRARWIATTTPRPIPLIRQLIAAQASKTPQGGGRIGVAVTRGRSEENLSNLAANFREHVIARYRGTRLGRQELDAEILEDVPGALWSRRTLDETRVSAAPDLARVVVAVDPAVSSGEHSNETGIVVMGLGRRDAHGYVLEDCSLRASPGEWARTAVAAYHKWPADCLVAEANQGGEMVQRVISSVADIPVKLVRATRGKYVRAEPVSALYEQGRVHHAGTFPVLEDQMIAFTPSSALRSEGENQSDSPDRVDALVWAATELFPDIVAPERKPVPRVEYSGVHGWMA